MSLMSGSNEWRCFAKPVSRNGQECGHQNQAGIRRYILGEKVLCCEECGCTKISSDDRKKKEGGNSVSIMSKMEGKFVNLFGEPIPIISVYTRAQAIEDGVLWDVSPVARAEGFKHPVALTMRVVAEVVVPPEAVADWQDDVCRLRDLLVCLRYAIGRSPHPTTDLHFKMDVMDDPKRRKTITLKAQCGPGDNLEPVISVMFPDED